MEVWSPVPSFFTVRIFCASAVVPRSAAASRARMVGMLLRGIVFMMVSLRMVVEAVAPPFPELHRMVVMEGRRACRNGPEWTGLCPSSPARHMAGAVERWCREYIRVFRLSLVALLRAASWHTSPRTIVDKPRAALSGPTQSFRKRLLSQSYPEMPAMSIVRVFRFV